MKRIISIALIMMMSATCFSFMGSGTSFAEEDVLQKAEAEETEPAEVTEPTEPAEPEKPQFKDMVPVISTSHNGEAIRICWNAVEGATGYQLYRCYAGSSKTMIANTRALSFDDKAVASGKRATYSLVAYKGSEKSLESVAVSDVIYRVYIETGHGRQNNGKWDRGCKWKKYQEAKLMIPIAKSMAKYMRANGVYVYTDADSGNNHNLNWTLNFLNSHSVSAFVNIHCDYKRAKAGTLPLYKTAEQKKLAAALNYGVHSTVKIRDRGLKKRKNLSTLNSKKVHCTACLFETGAIRRDNKLLRTQYDAYGKGLAKGLCSYLNISFR